MPTLASQLKDTSKRMADAAVRMEWEADNRQHWLDHARELMGAARVVNDWAKEVEKETEGMPNDEAP